MTPSRLCVPVRKSRPYILLKLCVLHQRSVANFSTNRNKHVGCVYICTCMYICDEVLTGSTYKGSHMVLRVRFILKKYKIYIFTDRWEHRYGYVYGTQIFSVVHAYCVWIFSITKSILIRTIYRIDTFFLEISWNLTSKDSRFESETLRNLETFEIRNFQNPSIIFSLFSFFF